MKHIFRNSDIQDFLSCRNRWDFRSVMRRGYRQLVDPDELNFGTAWHRAMEVWYDPNNPRNAERTINEFLKIIRQQDVLAREYGYEFDLAGSEDLGIGMLTYYFEWAQFNDDFEATKLEQEFEVPILDPRDGNPVTFYPYKCPCGAYSSNDEEHEWVFQGRVDAIFQRNDLSYWIGEHKTAKTETDWQWHVMEPQTLRYMWALKHSIGINIHGVIRTEALKRYPTSPRELKNGGLSVDKRQSTTTKHFLRALQDRQISLDGAYLEYVRFLQSLEAPIFVRREYVDFNVDQMEEAGNRLYYIAMDMISEPYIYPNATFMCRKCPFFIPCLVRQEQGDFEYALATQYRKVSSTD